VDVASGQIIRGNFKMLRQEENKRLYDVHFDWDVFVPPKPSTFFDLTLSSSSSNENNEEEEEDGKKMVEQEEECREIGFSAKYDLP